MRLEIVESHSRSIHIRVYNEGNPSEVQDPAANCGYTNEGYLWSEPVGYDWDSEDICYDCFPVLERAEKG